MESGETDDVDVAIRTHEPRIRRIHIYSSRHKENCDREPLMASTSDPTAAILSVAAKRRREEETTSDPQALMRSGKEKKAVEESGEGNSDRESKSEEESDASEEGFLPPDALEEAPLIAPRQIRHRSASNSNEESPRVQLSVLPVVTSPERSESPHQDEQEEELQAAPPEHPLLRAQARKQHPAPRRRESSELASAASPMSVVGRAQVGHKTATRAPQFLPSKSIWQSPPVLDATAATGANFTRAHRSEVLQRAREKFGPTAEQVAAHAAAREPREPRMFHWKIHEDGRVFLAPHEHASLTSMPRAVTDVPIYYPMTSHAFKRRERNLCPHHMESLRATFRAPYGSPADEARALLSAELRMLPQHPVDLTQNEHYELAKRELHFFRVVGADADDGAYGPPHTKRFRDAIYGGNLEKVSHFVLDKQHKYPAVFFACVLMSYSHRMITPFSLACRRGHLTIVDWLHRMCIHQQFHAQRSWPDCFHVPRDKDSEEPILTMCNYPHLSAERLHLLERRYHEKHPHAALKAFEFLRRKLSLHEANKMLRVKRILVRRIPSSPVADKRVGGVMHVTSSTASSGSSSGSNNSGDESQETSRKEATRYQYEMEHIKYLLVDRQDLPMDLCAFMEAAIVNQYDGDKRTPLSHAAEKGQIVVVAWLLKHPGINIEKGGEHHDEFWTPLHYAARYGHARVIEALVRRGANINALTSKKHSTALHLACATGNLEAVQTLLKHGANTDLEDIYLCTPLSLAIHFQEKMVQQALFNANIKISTHDARRLKRDDHMFRRFHWIKLVKPVCSTRESLPTLHIDLWCLICGFLSCRDLLLNVRRVCYGLLVTVHHPALRKLVNYHDSLPPKSEFVHYNKQQKTLCLKNPSKTKPKIYDKLRSNLLTLPALERPGVDEEVKGDPSPRFTTSPLPRVRRGSAGDVETDVDHSAHPSYWLPTDQSAPSQPTTGRRMSSESMSNNPGTPPSQWTFSANEFPAFLESQTLLGALREEEDNTANLVSLSGNRLVARPKGEDGVPSALPSESKEVADLPAIPCRVLERQKSGSSSHSEEPGGGSPPLSPSYSNGPGRHTRHTTPLTMPVPDAFTFRSGTVERSRLDPVPAESEAFGQGPDNVDKSRSSRKRRFPTAIPQGIRSLQRALHFRSNPESPREARRGRHSLHHWFSRVPGLNRGAQPQFAGGADLKYDAETKETKETGDALPPQAPPAPPPLPHSSAAMAAGLDGTDQRSSKPFGHHVQHLLQNFFGHFHSQGQGPEGATPGVPSIGALGSAQGVNHQGVQVSGEEKTEETELTDEEKEWRMHQSHCAAFSFTADFAPVSLRKIRLNGYWILSQPIVRAISCLSFIVHLEISHFYAQSLEGLELSCLDRLNKLRMVRQLKVFPIMRSTVEKSALDADLLSRFIAAVGSTALTVGLRWEPLEPSSQTEEHPQSANHNPIVQALGLLPSSIAGHITGSSTKPSAVNDFEEFPTTVSNTWKTIFSRLPDNIRSLRLHFGENDHLSNGAVEQLVGFENIKCFTLHGDPGLSSELDAWSNVFQKWNKLRYVVLGHRGSMGQLILPRLILKSLPKTLPELALNVSNKSVENVTWYLNTIVEADSFLRINLHITHEDRDQSHLMSINPEIIRCLAKFQNLETAYLKCGIVTSDEIKYLLNHCKKLSFVGFGIDIETQEETKMLIRQYGFDKIVVKKEINWLIAVKSYDKYLLDPSRCIHPVLEAFDEKADVRQQFSA